MADKTTRTHNGPPKRSHIPADLKALGGYANPIYNSITNEHAKRRYFTPRPGGNSKQR